MEDPGSLDFLTSKIGGLIVGKEALISIPPDSDGFDEALTKELRENVETVRPCDLVFTKTPGGFYSMMRSVTGEPFDHLAIVLDKKLALHIGPHRARALSLPLVLDPLREPLVLRPKLTPKERMDVLARCKEFLGKKYNTLRVYKFCLSLALQKLSSIELPMAPVDDSAKRWICTDAFWLALRSTTEFKRAIADPKLKATLDFSRLNAPSMSDFQRIESLSKALSQVDLPVTATTRSRALGKEGDSGANLLSTVMDLIVPNSISDAYEDIGPEGRLVITIVLAMLSYRFFRTYVFTDPDEQEEEAPKAKL